MSSLGEGRVRLKQGSSRDDEKEGQGGGKQDAYNSCARLYTLRQIYNSSTTIWLHMMTAALIARHQLTFLGWPVMMAIWLFFSLSLCQ